MDASRYRVVKDLLARVLELPAAERREELEQVGADDPELRREVEELLALERTLDEAQTPPIDPTEPTGPTETGEPADDATVPGGGRLEPRAAPGSPSSLMPGPRRIGPFRILELLGRGGMGVVYLAEQSEPIERRVALKVVGSPFLDPQVHLRFEAERRALARLSHPHIARLYEAGSTDDGSPWFAMELVEGEPITRHADHERLALRERLDLFLQACDAVAHAHQKGILHRDLKPSNILVARADGQASQAKIIDFGIAKALDSPLVDVTQLTRNAVLGTPAYMSPEIVQDASRADTRSDVYALGVVLYELLVGVRPLDHSQAHEDPFQLLQRILHDEPRRPSTRWRRLEESTRETSADERGLDPAEVLRALHGDLDWIVMKALAKDPDRRYQTVRELADDLERHLRDEPVTARPPTLAYRTSRFVRRHRLAVAAAALVLLALVAGIVGTSLGLLRARAEADAARKAQTEAEAVSDYMVELFRLASPEETGGADVTAQDLLSRGGALAAERFEAQPLAHARFLNAIAMSYQHLGFDQESVDHLRASLELLEPRRDEDPEAWLQAQTFLAWSLRRQGHNDEAEALEERALELLDSPVELESTTRAEILQRLGFGAARQGHYDRAKSLLERSLALYRATGAEDSEAAIRALDKMGVVHSVQGEHAESERLHRLAIERAEASLGSDNVIVATALMNLGASLAATGRFEEALDTAERATSIRRGIYGDSHAEVATPLANSAINLFQLGRFEESLERLGEARRILRELDEDQAPQIAQLDMIEANIQYRLGRHTESIEAFERSLRVREELFEPGHPALETTRSVFGIMLTRIGRFERAEELLETAKANLQALGPEHELVAMNRKHLASFDRLRGRTEDALRGFEQVIEPLARTQSAEHPVLVDARAELGQLLVELGRLDEAEPLILDALERRRAERGEEHPQIALSLESLAALATARGALDEAEGHLLRALEVREASQGPMHPEIVYTLDALSRLERASGRLERARAAERRAVEIGAESEVPELWLRSIRERIAADASTSG